MAAGTPSISAGLNRNCRAAARAASSNAAPPDSITETASTPPVALMVMSSRTFTSPAMST